MSVDYLVIDEELTGTKELRIQVAQDSRAAYIKEEEAIELIFTLIEVFQLSGDDINEYWSNTALKEEVKIEPLFYTTKEGGIWIRYRPSLHITKEILASKLAYAKVYNKHSIKHGNLTIHSLAFGDINTPNFPRWDCISGWPSKMSEIK